ncbi:MAG: MFS transporter [Hyphomicrobiales bacterium]
MPRAGRAGIFGWMLFDWAAQPFYTLVLTFLFAPYFAAAFLGDPVEGQWVWGLLTGVSALIVALLSPVLGAVADASGGRKFWVALFSVVFVAGLCGLWYAAPGARDMLLLVSVSFVAASVAAEFATVFTNAMMPGLVPPERLGRLSGQGWALGYAGGLVSLVIAAGLIVADWESGRTMLGLKPLLPLDHLAREGERAIGPFSALWYAVFVLPFFLFTPDHAPARKLQGSAVGEGLRQLRRTFAHIRQYREVLRFLLARMLYVDGLGAIFAFGGIYAASVFSWTSIHLGIFGVALTIAGALGAWAGGPLDDKLGSRAVILGSLALLMAGAVGVLSVDASHVFYGIAVAPANPGAAPFASTGEQVYLAFAVLLGLASGPLQSASRSYLARLAPSGMMTEFFGFYAFSGKATAFAAPLVVAAVTALSGSQRLGIASLLAFLLAGFVLMLGARDARR